jgi:hypothetical protein
MELTEYVLALSLLEESSGLFACTLIVFDCSMQAFFIRHFCTCRFCVSVYSEDPSPI